MSSTPPGTCALSTVLRTSFDDAVAKTTAALSEQGFGVLTTIDIKSTLKQKIDKDMEDYLILGACNPSLASRALDSDRRIGQLLPCNVVVRANTSGGGILVEAMDPQLMVAVMDEAGLQPVADEAAAKLRAAISTLAG
ncbi:DUF302 domain-containing protein [Mycobacterium sp.]|uniref:DUF302 domain-containing protein n=1 Tax=Mycobacterium sp. TaxID=1785 RepID=UPI003A88657B